MDKDKNASYCKEKSKEKSSPWIIDDPKLTTEIKKARDNHEQRG